MGARAAAWRLRATRRRGGSASRRVAETGVRKARAESAIRAVRAAVSLAWAFLRAWLGPRRIALDSAGLAQARSMEDLEAAREAVLDSEAEARAGVVLAAAAEAQAEAARVGDAAVVVTAAAETVKGKAAGP